MNFTLIKLEFNSPLHISKGWGEYDNSDFIIHSDTLKSAIYAVGLNLYPEWRNHYQEFNDSFFISSCFPFSGDEYFFPVLFPDETKFNIVDDGTENTHKKIKRIEYLSKSLFEDFLLGNSIEVSKEQFYSKKFLFEKSVSKISSPIWFAEEVQQRVAITANDIPRPFFINRLHFSNNSGLFFLADFKDDKIKNAVFQAIKLLGEFGIGTDRTVGNGFYDFDIKEHVIENFTINVPSQNDAYINLGMFWPTEKEVELIDWDKSAWNLVPRGGFMAGSEINEFKHLFKKTVYMFSPGSLFSCSAIPIGKYDDLKPLPDSELMHSVFRSGQPVFVPAILK